MAITLDDFNKIWASTSPLTPYSFSDANYKEGWNFVGATPPSRQMWDFLQKNNDEKMQYLANNYLPLSGGTLTGNLSINKDCGQIFIKNTNITKGVAPENDLYLWSPRIDDSEGRYLGGLDLVIQTTKQSFTALYNYSMHDVHGQGDYIGIGHDPDGNVITYAPTPAISDNSTNIATTEFVRYNVPAGIVQAYAGNTIPYGWLPCDGSAVSRTTFARLFSVIGTTYGAGDGSTTFNVPNLVDKFVQGSNTSGTVKTAGLPNIEGTIGQIGIGNWADADNASGAFNYFPNGKESKQIYNVSTSYGNIDKDSRLRFNASVSNSIYGNSTTVQPPALTMKYIIKT